MRSNMIETVMGAVVLVVAAFFLFVAYTSANMHAVKGYGLEARFSSTGGLVSGNDVRISGVKVGTVTATILDPKTFQAVVQIQVDPKIQLPVDTSASIASESLLGGKYLNLQPGGDDEMLKPGARIQYTQSAVNLEDLVGRFMFNAGSGGKPAAGGSAPAGGDAAPAAAPGGK